MLGQGGLQQVISEIFTEGYSCVKEIQTEIPSDAPSNNYCRTTVILFEDIAIATKVVERTLVRPWAISPIKQHKI